MKKIFALAILILVLALSACAQDAQPRKENASQEETQAQQNAAFHPADYDVEEILREDGLIQSMKFLHEDGTTQEYQCNAQGNITYYYEKNLVDAYEFFSDGEGNLLKYVENEKVYEGSEIRGNAKQHFKMLQETITEINKRAQEEE